MIVSFKFNNVEYSNWNISEAEIRQYLESKGIDLLPITKTEIQKRLVELEKQRVQSILDQYGYFSLADVQLYVNQNDDEAQKILNWYKSYDDGIWHWLDTELSNYQTVEELLALDVRQVEEQIYQNSITASPLP